VSWLQLVDELYKLFLQVIGLKRPVREPKGGQVLRFLVGPG
jgi:hypothetical protein